MKIIVFGGSGFIGSHVADVLTQKAHDVTIFDMKGSPYIRGDQHMVEGNILNEDVVDSVISGKDIVYNFISMADMNKCVREPVEATKVNVLGNSIILNACVRHKVKRYVYASTAYVYSKAGAVYKTTKQAAELFVETYKSTFGLNYTILRYGSLYGPRANSFNHIQNMIREAIETGKITYYGTGEETREYIHVRDAAELSVKILDDKYLNQHITLTGNQSLKYKDFLNMISEMMDIKVIYKKKTEDTHYMTTPYSFSPKMGRKLTNNPHIDLGQGLLDVMMRTNKEFQE